MHVCASISRVCAQEKDVLKEFLLVWNCMQEWTMSVDASLQEDQAGDGGSFTIFFIHSYELHCHCLYVYIPCMCREDVTQAFTHSSSVVLSMHASCMT